MNKLSNDKLVLSDKKKSKNGKGTTPKKIHRKIVKKQTEVVGKLLSTTIENVHPVQVKPKVQHKALSSTQGTVKKSITQSAVKKSLAPKVLAMTTEQTSTNLLKSRPIKKRPKELNSSTINKTEPKKIKLVKRVLKATPMTSKTTTTAMTTLAMPRVSAAMPHQLG
ncbi:uncharacterized protein LOC113555632 [Rhopalosiphum maidis]|uniref:uncharacterized protein LOC113555632 n=1 Tax=Rhopalosiphum maidis TaxID=43146 RepID=UPI000F006AE4|nr:uncharacterized protein LOC113555632 [Rhopalosiphum maidis]